MEDQYLDWRGGLVFLCSGRIPEDGTPVPEHEINTCHEFFYDL